MLNRSKILGFFDASKEIDIPVHVVGCGAIGSHVCEQLARMGVENVNIWDFDKVEPKNITNQMFLESDIGMLKVDAVELMMKSINPDIKVTKHPKGLESNMMILNGYIFLCVDNIELRKAIVKANMMNPNAAAFADFRMRLTDAQYYFARRNNRNEVENLLNSMDFTHEEAAEATPQSACGVEQCVIYTVKNIVTYGMQNFVKFFKDKNGKLANVVLTDMVNMSVDCFSL